MKELGPLLDGLSSAYHDGRRLVLLFDYDGTLTPIADHRRQACLTPATRRLLKGLATRPRVVLGILSGRALEDLKEMVCLPEVYYAGTSGLEVEFFGVRLVHPEVRRGELLVAHVVGQLRGLAARFPGVWVENKQLGLTLHYRGLPEEYVAGLRAEAKAVLRLTPDPMRVTEGPMALEITPNFGWNKGTAIQMILQHLGGEPHVAIYAGDGANDQEAMEVVATLGGYAIGIGADAPGGAQYRLADQAALMAFLGELDALLGDWEPHDASPPANPVALHGLWKGFLPTNPR